MIFSKGGDKNEKPIFNDNLVNNNECNNYSYQRWK